LEVQGIVDTGNKARKVFPLRLPRTAFDEARVQAQLEGISLNHFISLAVVEKLARIESRVDSKAATAIQPLRARKP
jgi:hypothetical protein